MLSGNGRIENVIAGHIKWTDYRATSAPTIKLPQPHRPTCRTTLVLVGWVIFYVTDVDALYERALAAGYQPATVPRDAEWGERFFHLVDPDGHELSFAQPLLPGCVQWRTKRQSARL